MSRKWSPNTEVARDKLFDQLMFSGLSVEQRWQLIDDFAHALAEQQRAWITDRTDMPWWADEIADVIDPEKSAGLRPDEETT